MVMVKENFPRLPSGEIHQSAWISLHFNDYKPSSQTTIDHTYTLAKSLYQQEATFYGQSCFEQGLECAEILGTLQADAASVACGLLYCTIQNSEIDLEDLAESCSPDIFKLIQGLSRMSGMTELHQRTNRTSRQQIDNLRRMLLAMASDVRIVMIMLAMRVCVMRGIQILGSEERLLFAEETMDMFAPLANRLGISGIKWELEDLAFRDTDPNAYKQIAQALQAKRTTREHRIETTMLNIESKLIQNGLTPSISGRAKHIYSIYKKMQRKQLPFEEIYDTQAIRVIVPSVDDCYRALSIIHDLWSPIPKEFDDYIAQPKANGYQSIHTAVFDDADQYLEIQIRTTAMHEKNELGGAAHWLYKEGSTQQSNQFEAKIAWLRELLDWHRELTHNEDILDPFHERVFEDRIYVFTPNGDIIDLPTHASPLDFAYHVHSSVGHRCKGAKVNGRMVALTHVLQTGDRVDILTTKEEKPSRDWLMADAGYLHTAKARAKVQQWFKKNDSTFQLDEGKALLEKALQQYPSGTLNLEKLSQQLRLTHIDQLYQGLATGNIKLNKLHQTIQTLLGKNTVPTSTNQTVSKTTHLNTSKASAGIRIHGMSNLMTHLANCCNPIPGDAIIGYITMGKGVSIHRQNCQNMLKLSKQSQSRLIAAQWDDETETKYVVDLQITTENSDITQPLIVSLLANDKMNALRLTTRPAHKHHADLIDLSLQITSVDQLNRIINKLSQLAGVKSIKRAYYHGI